MTPFFFFKLKSSLKDPFFFIVLTKWPPILLLLSLKDPLFSLFSLSPKDPYFGGRVRTYPSLPPPPSQPHSPGWARVPLSSFFPQISINFSYFSSNFTYFLPHFGPPVAHPGRPWLRHSNQSDCLLASSSCSAPLIACIDHSHIALIYRRSERVGPFTRICRPDWTGNESCPGRNCQQMQMYGTRVKENFRKYSLSERVSC